MTDFTGGTWRSLVDGNEISAIPDSVVSRESDDSTDTVSGGTAYGMEFTTSVEWLEIGGEISANTDGVTRVRIKRASDGQIMGSITGQNLTGGDTYTITLDSNLVSGETYYLLHDAEGSSYTLGSFSGANYNYNSSDSNLSLTENVKEGGSTSLGPSGTVRFGYIGF